MSAQVPGKMSPRLVVLRTYLEISSQEHGKVLRATTQNDAVYMRRSIAEFDGQVGECRLVEVTLVQCWRALRRA
jgi:hypothetical protein